MHRNGNGGSEYGKAAATPLMFGEISPRLAAAAATRRCHVHFTLSFIRQGHADKNLLLVCSSGKRASERLVPFVRPSVGLAYSRRSILLFLKLSSRL